MAAENIAVDPDVSDMVINRLLDNAAVAVASINRTPVTTARAQALAHQRPDGATLFGVSPSVRVEAQWAAWANGTAVRELDFHDTFLAADYSHPADNIPALLAVAQQLGINGSKLIQGIVTAYEVQVNLVRSICLHEHKIDHIAHLGPSVAAGIGTMLDLDVEVIYQAIQQALHTTVTTRQSRKGEISSWKAFAPGYAGKAAIEAVDRAMRGEGSPSPIYEGEDSVIAQVLSGPNAEYWIPLPATGEPRRAIMDTYTKEHSAEYQSQALIDLAADLGTKIEDFSQVKDVLLATSHHTHNVIGTGAGDPEKMDPKASRETLDHSIMYILAVALQDRTWHHERSYDPSRAARPDTVELWHKIRTIEDPEWTRRYHSSDPAEKAFGGRVEITMEDGTKHSGELAVANAHPLGSRPFERPNYIEKFNTLTEGILESDARTTFVDAVQRLPELSSGDLLHLNPWIDETQLTSNTQPGIF